MKAQALTKETIRYVGTENRGFPEFRVGDTIAVSRLIREGDKERIQLFQGDVIAMRNHGSSSTFTIRKIGAHGVPVEIILPYYSPILKDVKVIKRGDVRRAKLYYVRDRIGKSARVKEKILTREQKEQKEAGIAAAQEEHSQSVSEDVSEKE